MSKYRNVKTEVDGILFDSKAEARRYCELKLLVKAGKIKDLKLQPKFELQPKFKKNGTIIQAIIYKADFEYYDVILERTIVEDCKGFRTKDYILKKKMFEFKYPHLELTEVS